MVEDVQMLLPWQEVRGVLQQIKVDESRGLIILHFRLGPSIGIPLEQQLKEKLVQEVGHGISILCTNLPGRLYLVVKD